MPRCSTLNLARLLMSETAPANGVVEYKTVTFQAQRSPRTPYMPPEEGGLPDDSTDLAWEDLYKGDYFQFDPFHSC
jgi:hypothetical protein